MNHVHKINTIIAVLVAMVALCLKPSSNSYAQGGHGPVFTLATPTLGQGELSFDVMAMSTRQGSSAWMILQNWHYGLTEDIQLNVSLPTSLQKIDNPPQGRLGTMMGSYGDLEVSGLFRLFKTYPGVGQRFESTLLLSGSVPTEDQRGGIEVGPSLHGGLVTGYASRTFHAWAGGGYQYYSEQHNDRLGDIAYVTGVIGYRPPVFQHDYPKSDRRYSGYRIFTRRHIDQIKFIKRAQELGFTLSEIKELLELRMDDDTTCSEIKSEAQAKYQDVIEKMEDLQRIKETLVELIDSCSGSGPKGACPILEALEGENETGKGLQ